MPRPFIIACAAALLTAPAAFAQQAPVAPQASSAPAQKKLAPNPMNEAMRRTRSELQTAPAPRPEDVGSVDAIIAALYNVISGPAGQPRDWQRFQSLFYPGAQMIPMRKPKAGPSPVATPFSPEAYVSSATVAFGKRGFYEKELHRQTAGYGHLVHVMSAYETRESPNGPALVQGVNSIQLVFDGQRWWILNIAWTDDKATETPVPKDFTRK
ncbi:nuclear transport factor 2 family protein [Comamonas sp. JC664]|uniref:nuclear transport factor 2 family protein n=1 Tax=Comamonas sp. JC664 TaxID=2801917 RepID=UPI00174C26DB|nr:nuclear transport factor 2 family protein [Comamonas sp. JC664]MBL0695468.1 hypothetical protein [Comamonas sp. JC664]GHG88169.1 hypothetical protein GCM10012319_46720 [Comamonas sp. KCTC 72670]